MWFPRSFIYCQHFIDIYVHWDTLHIHFWFYFFVSICPFTKLNLCSMSEPYFFSFTKMKILIIWVVGVKFYETIYWLANLFFNPDVISVHQCSSSWKERKTEIKKSIDEYINISLNASQAKHTLRSSFFIHRWLFFSLPALLQYFKTSSNTMHHYFKKMYLWMQI